MVDIVHRIAISGSSPEEVYTALTTVDGLAAWWTDGHRGGRRPRRTAEVPLRRVGGFDMQVVETAREEVLWKVVDGPAEWIGTR